MKCYRSAAGFIPAVLIVLSLAGPAAAGDLVPFKGTLDGSFSLDPNDPPFRLLIGTGNATHLGQFTLVFPHRVDRSTVPATGVGVYTIKAANGDLLFADVYGEATLVAPGILHGVEVATITGGTGRFASASGQFVMERLIDTVNLTTIGAFEGTISSRGR